MDAFQRWLWFWYFEAVVVFIIKAVLRLLEGVFPVWISLLGEYVSFP